MSLAKKAPPSAVPKCHSLADDSDDGDPTKKEIGGRDLSKKVRHIQKCDLAQDVLIVGLQASEQALDVVDP